MDPLGQNLRILIKNCSKSEFADPPQEVPKTTKTRPNLVKGRLGGSKVRSGTLSDGCSGFLTSFWIGLGRPRTLKIELPLKRELNFHFGPDTQKVRFLASFWAPLWRLWGTLGAQVGHFGSQNSEKRGCQKKLKKIAVF